MVAPVYSSGLLLCLVPGTSWVRWENLLLLVEPGNPALGYNPPLWQTLCCNGFENWSGSGGGSAAAGASGAAPSKPYTGKADNYATTGQRSVESSRTTVSFAADVTFMQGKWNWQIAQVRPSSTWSSFFNEDPGNVDDMNVDEMAKTNSYVGIWSRRDRSFQFGSMIVAPSEFENYPMKLQRRTGPTLQEYQAEYVHTETPDNSSWHRHPREDPNFVGSCDALDSPTARGR